MAKKKTSPATVKAPKSTKTVDMGVVGDFDALKKEVDTIVSGYGERDADFVLYENAYRIDPTDRTSGKTNAPQARLMYDPQGHNVIDSIVRMYMANEPTITVPTTHVENTGFDIHMADTEKQEREKSDKLERWLRAALYASDLTSTSQFVADSLYAAAIYGEVPQIIDNAYAQESGDPNAIVEAPFIFYVPSPRMSYPVYTRRNNLIKHIVKTQVKLAEVRSTYADGAAFIEESDDSIDCNVVDYIDLQKHVVWVEEYSDQPVLAAALAHGFIPRTSRRSTSPGFFDEPKFKNMPLMFAYIKAGLWAARNILLTATYTNAVDYMNPLMLFKKKPGGTAPVIDWSKRGSVVDIEVGEDLGPLTRSSVTPEIFEFTQQVAALADESTMANSTIMPRQKAGVGAASALNMLSNASRVTTYMISKTVEMAMAQTLTKTLRWIKARGDTVDVWGQEGKLTISASDIGDNYHVVVALKPDMQAEKQMVAGLAATLFERVHLGYDTTLEILEEGDVVNSAEEAFDNIIERAFIEGELPDIVKGAKGFGHQVLGVVQSIPSSQSPQNPAQPQMPAQPAQAIPPAEGVSPGGPVLPTVATGQQGGPLG